MPVDPVCGIELDEDIALIHDHKGKNFYFCCNGCRKIFIKKPRKYKNNVQIGNAPHILQNFELLTSCLQYGHLHCALSSTGKPNNFLKIS